MKGMQNANDDEANYPVAGKNTANVSLIFVVLKGQFTQKNENSFIFNTIFWEMSVGDQH